MRLIVVAVMLVFLMQEAQHELLECRESNETIFVRVQTGLFHQLFQLGQLQEAVALLEVFMNELRVDVLLLSHGGIAQPFFLIFLELFFFFGDRLHLVEEELKVPVRQLLVGEGVCDELGVFDFLVVVDVDLV